MSANEVVLGLLIERPGTGYQLDKRLKEDLPAARFSRDTARQALRRLAKQGYVRPVDGREGGSAEGARDEGTAYEATAAGARHFSAWVESSVSLPPVREDLLAKLALCTPEDLPRMVETVREAELSCAGKLRGLNWRTRKEYERVGPRAWKLRMGMVAAAAEAAWWDGRIKWLQKVRLDLESELRSYEAERRSPRPSPGGVAS